MAATDVGTAREPAPAAPESRAGPRPRGGRHVGVHRYPVVRVVGRTIGQAWADRILGLAAEVAFWTLLSLTPLLLVLVGALGYLQPLFGEQVADRFEGEILSMADDVLEPSAVDQLLRPVLDDVLRHGHAPVVSVGFVLALWTGSTAMSTYVNTIT